jgi:hypothetical protein
MLIDPDGRVLLRTRPADMTSAFPATRNGWERETVPTRS